MRASWGRWGISGVLPRKGPDGAWSVFTVLLHGWHCPPHLRKFRGDRAWVRKDVAVADCGRGHAGTPATEQQQQPRPAAAAQARQAAWLWVLVSPCPLHFHSHRTVEPGPVGQRGALGSAASQYLGANGPLALPSRAPSPPPQPSPEGWLGGRLRPNPLQVTSEASEQGAREGRRGGTPGVPPPDPTSALRLRRRLFRKQSGCPVPVMCPCVGSSHFPHMTLRNAGPQSPEGGGLGSLTHPSKAQLLLSSQPFPGAQEAGSRTLVGTLAGRQVQLQVRERTQQHPLLRE